MMEAASTSETSVSMYQTTRRNNPEHSHRHTRRRENLKSHLCKIIFLYFIHRIGVNWKKKHILEVFYLRLQVKWDNNFYIRRSENLKSHFIV
jgi:hypothetical protein